MLVDAAGVHGLRQDLSENKTVLNHFDSIGGDKKAIAGIENHEKK